jgi:hypothetical protein
VCFELLTGWPPFYDWDFTKMCEKILYKPLVFPIKKYNITRDAEEVGRCVLSAFLVCLDGVRVVTQVPTVVTLVRSLRLTVVSVWLFTLSAVYWSVYIMCV